MYQDKYNVSITTIQSLKENLLCSSIWTPDEDKVLFSFVRFNGIDKWERCAALFKNKTGAMCKERYLSLLKKKIILCKSCKDKLKVHIKRKIMKKYYLYRQNKLMMNSTQNKNICDNSTHEIKQMVN